MQPGAKVGIGIAVIAVTIVIAGNLSEQDNTTESMMDNPVQTTTDSQIIPPSPQSMHTNKPVCDPSYPDFCIPSPPPDLNCGDISEKRFTVLPPDPHRLDRDKDGIGCES